MEQLLAFIQRLISARDPYMKEQSERVARLTMDLARQLELPPARSAALEFAARIHNIGNLAISDSVLFKPSRLTEAEFLMIQQHTVLGVKIVEPLNFDPTIRAAILHHHENYDGTGYPHRLKGDEIPIEARILRIVDTYDALIHQRSYRPPYSHEAALEILQENRQCFSPQILDTFLEMESE